MEGFFESLEKISIGQFSLATLVSALLTAALCVVLFKIITRLVRRALERTKLEKGLRSFVYQILRFGLWALMVIIVADALGISTASLVAVLSVVSLSLSLALQDILANLFSGMTILATKPFVAGSFVELGGVSGKVKEVGLFHTTVDTVDNKCIYIPNSEVTSSKIINYSQEANRRIDMRLQVSYDARPETVKAALLEAVAGDGRILSEPAPFAALSAYGDSAVEYILRAWVPNDDYWDVYYALNERVGERFAAHGIEMTYNHLNVHLIPEEKS